MSPNRAAAATLAWHADPASPFVRVTPRARQRAATRERLYAAALAEFRRVGFEHASVSDIARAARASRPSFYAHFPTLSHVLLEMAWRFSQQIVQRFESADGLPATLDRLADALIEAEQAVGDSALFREVLSVFVRQRDALPMDTNSIPVLRELVQRFEVARVAGELRTGMPPEQAARLCLSGVFGYLLTVDATPAERRADLRALFSLHLAERPRRSR